ncbi:UNVERIFIED_CONTAM: hypothetical protein BEN50_21540 [Euhalothece sp. KZN 001]
MERLTLHQIAETTAEEFGLTVEDLRGKKRTRAVVRPRQLAMCLARDLTVRSLPEIGRYFRRDHTTVLNALDRIAALRALGGELDERARRLHTRLALHVEMAEERWLDEQRMRRVLTWALATTHLAVPRELVDGRWEWIPGIWGLLQPRLAYDTAETAWALTVDAPLDKRAGARLTVSGAEGRTTWHCLVPPTLLDPETNEEAT